MTKRIEDAVSVDGPVVAAWGQEKAGQAWLGIYTVGAVGAVLIADEDVPSSEKTGRTAELRAKRIRVGATWGGEFVWTADDNGFSLWSLDSAIADGTRLELRLPGETVQTATVAQVISYFDDDDLGHRGVLVELHDRRRVIVVEEHDPAAKFDPSYNRENRAIDSTWSRRLGRDLADWLGVPHQLDSLAPMSSPSSTPIGRLTSAAITLAERSLREAPDGIAFAAIDEDLSAGEGSHGRVVLRLAPRPLDPETGRYLLLLVYTKSGESEASQWLADGTRDEVVAFLRSPSAPLEIEATIRRLAESQRRQGLP